MKSTSADVAIVGAGPIGIELAVALKKARIDYLQFDARQIGHTVSWFAQQTRFFSSNERIAIAGVPLNTPDQSKSTREQYLTYLRGIVQQFDLKINLYEAITGIERNAGGFVLTTQKHAGQQRGQGAETLYHVQKIILATGGTERPRKLGVPGEDLPHVTHYFHDPHDYFQQRLTIVGGRNSAVEAALRCHYAGASVTLVHRRPQLDANSIKYWLWPEINGLIKSNAIQAHFNSHLTEILPDRLIIQDASGKSSDLPTDFVLLLIGYEADMALFRMAGVNLINPGSIPQFDPQTMQTNVPGIYVAGTAGGGTQQRYALFIENCHIHVDKIVASLTGAAPPKEEGSKFDRPES